MHLSPRLILFFLNPSFISLFFWTGVWFLIFLSVHDDIIHSNHYLLVGATSTGSYGIPSRLKQSTSCLNPGKKFTLRRTFSYEDQEYPLRIEVSDRASHRIVSEMLSILLQEQLGYSNVTFINHSWDNVTTTINRLICSKRRGCKGVPESFINMEVWIPSDYSVEHRVNRDELVSGGLLGPVSQMGIFIDLHLLKHMSDNISIHLAHYGALQNTHMRQRLMKNVMPYNERDVSSEWQLVIDQCQGGHSASLNPCFHLFFDRPEFLRPLSNLLQQVFKFPTFRVYLAKNVTIEEWVKRLDNMDRTSMRPGDFFLYWNPSVLLTSKAYSQVHMPDSYVSMTHKILEDFSPFYRLSKFMWSHLRTHAFSAYELVRKMRFSQEEYVFLLNEVRLIENALETKSAQDPLRKENVYYKVACQWLKANQERWRPWIVKEKLFIHALFPSGGKCHIPNLQTIAQSAIKTLNKDLFSTTNFVLVLLADNIECEEEVALKSYMEKVDTCRSSPHPILAVLAALPPKSLEPLIKLTNLHKRVVISPTVESASYLFGKENYNYFFRTAPSARYYSHLLVNALEFYKWKRVVLLKQDRECLTESIFDAANIKVLEKIQKSEENITFEFIHRNLQRVKEEAFARIFITDYNNNVTTMILCAAVKLNMTYENGFIWFIKSSLVLTNSAIAKQPNNFSMHGCTKHEMLLAIDGHFFLDHDAAHAERGSEQEVPSNETSQKFSKGMTLRSGYGAFTYDAVYMLGLTAFQMLKLDGSVITDITSNTVADRFRYILATIRWTRPLLHGTKTLLETISFDQNNERASSRWVLKQFRNGFIVPSISWEMAPHEDSNSSLPEDWEFMSIKGIRWKSYRRPNELRDWPNNNEEPPSDGQKELNMSMMTPFPCQVYPLNKWLSMPCQATLGLLSGIGLLILMICSFSIVCCLRQKWLRAKANYVSQFQEMLGELHRLQIPVQPITTLRLTRELGKGAFGVVFGGECQWNGQWESVAAKVSNLKRSTECKMDFLHEVYIMSKLKYRNIASFYCVCVDAVEERLYLVMEALPHGDLHRYLFSRRTKCRSNPRHYDLCAKTLTQFARDIASALDYMHTCDLIHRDVACRNCLVSSSYRVKLGDFGLTREMRISNQDRYYRFQHIINLPVRWMSPQALNFGLYDKYSDIWAFGITLFEIITFGDLPYNCNNSDVIEKVKRYQVHILDSLPQPVMDKPICDLIKQCCAYNIVDRPKSMAAVEEFLKQHPELVEPCLTNGPSRHVPPPVRSCNPDGHYGIVSNTSCQIGERPPLSIANDSSNDVLRLARDSTGSSSSKENFPNDPFLDEP